MEEIRQKVNDMDKRLLVLETNEVHRRDSLGRIHQKLECIDRKVAPKQTQWLKVIGTVGGVAMLTFVLGAAVLSRYADRVTVEVQGKAIQKNERDIRDVRDISVYNMKAQQAIGQTVTEIARSRRLGIPEDRIPEMPEPPKVEEEPAP